MFRYSAIDTEQIKSTNAKENFLPHMFSSYMLIIKYLSEFHEHMYVTYAHF